MSGGTDADATVLVEKEESARAPTSSAHEGDVIEADVQSLLEEMAASFKSFSETVFAKIDRMTDKVQTLEKSVDVLPAAQQEGAAPELSKPEATPAASGSAPAK